MKIQIKKMNYSRVIQRTIQVCSNRRRDQLHVYEMSIE